MLFAVAGGGTSEALVDAHEQAVGAAVAYLEREACWTRRGHAGAERVRGEGFVAAAYRHRLSRAGDPQGAGGASRRSRRSRGRGRRRCSAPSPTHMRRRGSRCSGAAPTARAARELRDAAGVDAGTLHALAGVLDRRGGFPRGSVLLLDEAGMAATRISARVFAHAERAGVKVIAVGDAGQLSSVEAGGWFAALTAPAPGLRCET